MSSSIRVKTFNLSLQSFAYDTEELQLIWDSDNINAAKKENNDALFMDISLVNNMPKFKIIDHGYNFSTTKFMLNEEGPQNNRGTIWKLYFSRSLKLFPKGNLYKVKTVRRIDDETFLIGFTVDLCRLKFEN